MELLTQVPETGTKLRIDSDRQFDRPHGDSVLRVQGSSADGGANVFDAAYVELNDQEAVLVGHLLRQTLQPSPKTQDMLAQEIQAAFSSQLSARDAAQIAAIVSRAWWNAAQAQIGIGEEPETKRLVGKLAERFDRTAAKRREPAWSANGDETPGRSRSASH